MQNVNLSSSVRSISDGPDLPRPVPLSGVRDQDSRRELVSADFLLTIALIGDALMVFVGLVSAFWIRFKSGWITFGVDAYQLYDLGDYLSLILVGTVFLLLAFGYLRLYDRRNLLRLRRVVAITFRATTFWLFAYVGVSLALKFQPPISRIYVFLSYVGTLGALLAWRWCFHRLVGCERIASKLRQRMIFVGWNTEAKRLTEMVASDPSHPYEIVGCVPPPGGMFESDPPKTVPLLGEYSQLDKILKKRLTEIVILADLNPDIAQIAGIANSCQKEFVQFKVIPSYFQILVSALQLETISGVPILGISELPLDRVSNRLLKRAVDLIGGFVGLCASIPIMAWCGALVYWESPGPIFFGQERIGRNGRRFTMFKLRSMKVGADLSDHENQSTRREDPRLLKIGKFMRRWNLDEVPQFWNVLKGDMSLVGPRPERTFHSIVLSDKIPHYNARYAINPGITGWAQINGLRGDTDLAERVRYDLFYLENWSILLDAQIMVQTFFKRDNAY